MNYQDSHRSSVWGSCRHALHWRLLLLSSAAQALPLVLACLPLWVALAEELDHSLLSQRLVRGSDPAVLLEALLSLRRHGYSMTSALGGALLFLLTLPWLAGTLMTAARSCEPLGFGALIDGGRTEYWRMTRLYLWALVPLGIAVAAGAGAFYLANQHASRVTLAADADLAKRSAALLAVALFLLADATLDAARAQLVIDPQRRSVVRAWFRGTGRVFRRPVLVLLYLLLTAAGLLVAALFGWLRILTPAVGLGGLSLAFVLGQALVVSLTWMRCARLFMLVAAGNRQAKMQAVVATSWT